MVTNTNEQALEACTEKALTGTCREQLELAGMGFGAGTPNAARLKKMAS